MNTSPLLPLHERAGARLTAEDSPRVITYGDVPAEYAAARDGCVLFDETRRGAVTVTGGDAPEFLHRLLANVVRALEPGQGNRNLLLTAKGKVLHDFHLAREAEAFELSTPEGDAPRLITNLDMYLFAEDVELGDASEEHAPLTLAGPRAEAVAREVLGAEAPDAAYAVATAELEGGGTVRVRRRTVAGQPGLELCAPPDAAPALWERLVAAGALPAGIALRDILRVEACSALFGEDIDDNVYPQEARLEDAFSLEKGCYIGQEVVAKIDTYGGLNKRLCALKVDHDDPVPRGERLCVEDDGEWRDLGMVTSWAYSFLHDTGMVLAYVKRKHQEPGTVFRLGDGPGQATLVQ